MTFCKKSIVGHAYGVEKCPDVRSATTDGMI